MPTVAELLQSKQESQIIGPEENNEVSTIASIFAGIGSGFIDIPKGLFSLGASIYDLTNDTNKAAEIEKYFDDLKGEPASNLYDLFLAEVEKPFLQCACP